MKRLSILLSIGLALAVLSAGAAYPEGPSEMNFTGTHYYGHTPKVFKLDADQMIIQFETLGVRVNDNGEGLFHEASVHLTGVLYRGKNGSRLRGFETWTDANGDKLVWELINQPSGNAPPGTSSGTATVFSGTGKYAGMQGTMEWVLHYPKAFPDGTGRGVCKEKVKLSTAK